MCVPSLHTLPSHPGVAAPSPCLPRSLWPYLGEDAVVPLLAGGVVEPLAQLHQAQSAGQLLGRGEVRGGGVSGEGKWGGGWAGVRRTRRERSWPCHSHTQGLAFPKCPHTTIIRQLPFLPFVPMLKGPPSTGIDAPWLLDCAATSHRPIASFDRGVLCATCSAPKTYGMLHPCIPPPAVRPHLEQVLDEDT